MKNVLEYLENTAQRLPDKPAFLSDTGSLTFRQVLAQARAIGSALCRRGLSRQGIAVLMEKSPDTIAAFLGVIYAGCFYVPLDPEMPRQRLTAIFQTLQPPATICDGSTEELVRSLDGTGALLEYGSVTCEPESPDRLAAIRDRQIDADPIYIVFTSGSTGVPKGVVGCHRGVIDYIENFCRIMDFDESTIFGNQTPLYFDACLKEIIPTLKYGASMVLIPRQLFLFPAKLVEYLNNRKINTLCWVVSALTFLSSFHTFESIVPRYLRTVAFASEVFPIRQLNLWRNALPGVRFINLYGPTEATGICCYYEVDRNFAEDEALPIGRPFCNTDILLLDENNRTPPPGEPGEICVRGTRLTLGYYRDPARTEDVFVQNPLNPLFRDPVYRTGDLGRLNPRGELEFVGRKDHQIKLMGHRIELGEVESAAQSVEGISAACCTFDPRRNRITLHYCGAVDPRELALLLKEKLPRYMLPHSFRQLPALPHTPNGKIDRNALSGLSGGNHVP